MIPTRCAGPSRKLWQGTGTVLGARSERINRSGLSAPSGADKKSFPRGVPMQHVAPRQNPERSKGLSGLGSGVEVRKTLRCTGVPKQSRVQKAMVIDTHTAGL